MYNNYTANLCGITSKYNQTSNYNMSFSYNSKPIRFGGGEYKK